METKSNPAMYAEMDDGRIYRLSGVRLTGLTRPAVALVASALVEPQQIDEPLAELYLYKTYFIALPDGGLARAQTLLRSNGPTGPLRSVVASSDVFGRMGQRSFCVRATASAQRRAIAKEAGLPSADLFVADGGDTDSAVPGAESDPDSDSPSRADDPFAVDSGTIHADADADADGDGDGGSDSDPDPDSSADLFVSRSRSAESRTSAGRRALSDSDSDSDPDLAADGWDPRSSADAAAAVSADADGWDPRSSADAASDADGSEDVVAPDQDDVGVDGWDPRSSADADAAPDKDDSDADADSDADVDAGEQSIAPAGVAPGQARDGAETSAVSPDNIIIIASR